jgi:hypothetical protein
VLPDAGEIDETQVNDLDAAILEQTEDVRGRRRGLELHGKAFLL